MNGLHGNPCIISGAEWLILPGQLKILLPYYFCSFEDTRHTVIAHVETEQALQDTWEFKVSIYIMWNFTVNAHIITAVIVPFMFKVCDDKIVTLVLCTSA